MRFCLGRARKGEGEKNDEVSWGKLIVFPGKFVTLGRE
jgi:hypothetical protein